MGLGLLLCQLYTGPSLTITSNFQAAGSELNKQHSLITQKYQIFLFLERSFDTWSKTDVYSTGKGFYETMTVIYILKLRLLLVDLICVMCISACVYNWYKLKMLRVFSLFRVSLIVTFNLNTQDITVSILSTIFFLQNYLFYFLRLFFFFSSSYCCVVWEREKQVSVRREKKKKKTEIFYKSVCRKFH